MIGQSFAPLGNDDPRQQPGAVGGPGGSPVQEAIKLLSLRMPRTLGASAPAPQGLLNSHGMAGMGGNPLTALIMQMLQQGGMGAQGAAGAAPAPKVGYVAPPLPPGSAPIWNPPTETAPAPGGTAGPAPTPRQELGGFRGPTGSRIYDK